MFSFRFCVRKIRHVEANPMIFTAYQIYYLKRCCRFTNRNYYFHSSLEEYLSMSVYTTQYILSYPNWIQIKPLALSSSSPLILAIFFLVHTPSAYTYTVKILRLSESLFIRFRCASDVHCIYTYNVQYTYYIENTLYLRVMTDRSRNPSIIIISPQQQTNVAL